MDAFLIILTGILVAANGGIIGSFLLLRRMAMISDAISHAILPGIVFAYLITGHRSPFVMIVGATSMGILTTFLIELFTKKAKLQEGVSIGITFTWLFAVGVILISKYTGTIDLDQDCVLYGDILYVPLNPESIITIGIIFILNLFVVIIGYRGFFFTSFDPDYSVSIGVPNTLWHYLLMVLTSLVTVVSFEAVGAILVVAFLIIPAASAYLLTDKLPVMIALSLVYGAIASVSGYYVAVALDGSVAAAMASCAGILFLLTLLFSPSRGIVVKNLFYKIPHEKRITEN